MTPTSPGWYDDPHQADQLRYFDGIVWTAHVAPRRTREAAPAPIVPAPPTAPGGEPGAQSPVGQEPADPYGWRTPQAGPPAAGGGQQQWPGQQPGQQWPGQQPGQQWPGQQPGQPQQQWQQTPPYAGPVTPDGVPLAGYWQRVGASILDSLLAGVISGILGGWLIWKAMAPWWNDLMDAAQRDDTSAMENLSRNLSDQLNSGYFLAYLGLTLAVHLIYHVFFLTRSGATPGKRAVGISVRRVGAPGPLTLVAALRRQAISVFTNILGVIPGLFGFIGSLISLADVLFPLRDAKRQALHDKMADTVVVRGQQPKRS